MPVDQTLLPHHEIFEVNQVDRDDIHTNGDGEIGNLYYNNVKEEWEGAINDGTLKPLGITPSPFIERTSVSCLAPSATETITIEGKSFTDTTTFVSDNATFSNYVYLNPCEIQVDITTNATTGNITLEALNGDSSSNNYAGSLNMLLVSAGVTLIPGSNATWANVSANVTTGTGSVFGGTASGWNKQATFGTIAAGTDAILKFTVNAPPVNSAYGMFGFGVDPTANASYNTIDHCFYIQNQALAGTGNLYIYENGASRGLQGSIAAGDVLEIRRNGGVVTYYINGNLTYTSPVASTGAIHFDMSIYRNASISNISLQGC